MKPALGLGSCRQGDVHPLGFEALIELRLLQGRLARLDRGRDGVLDGVEPGPGLAPFVRRHGAEPLHEGGDLAALAQGLHAHVLEPGRRGRGRGRLQPFRLHRIQIVHGPDPTNEKGPILPSAPSPIPVIGALHAHFHRSPREGGRRHYPKPAAKSKGVHGQTIAWAAEYRDGCGPGQFSGEVRNRGAGCASSAASPFPQPAHW
jgi:hypothetical protein